MPIAIITDIHGHAVALEACLATLDAMAIDEIYCLGDIVDGGADSPGCVAMIRERGIPSVRGNHDEYHDIRFEGDEAEWLKQLPIEMTQSDWYMIHDNPRQSDRKLKDPIEAWNCFDDTDYKKMMVGHSHVPSIYEYPADGRTNYDVQEYAQSCDIKADCRYLISVPSLAYNRGMSNKPGYCIIDAEHIAFYYLDVKPLIEW